jgi:ABC-type polysaccharide/polyol phosphate transport system ATPase subunit
MTDAVRPLIEFQRVSKMYRRGVERANVRAALPGPIGGQVRGRDLHRALDEVDLHLSEGESLGLVGHNGAGKSTILKIVAGVTRPTSGRVAVRGRVAALIELGAGFHPDMTGRENIRFSAAVMGMRRRELARRFDQIVEFADIGPYLDTPVKRYSSGMMARLGFAVAAHLDAESIVVDEVLAVGDAAFQRKCFERMQAMRASGVAVLYVTHTLWTLPILCQRAILMSGGKVVVHGKPHEVLATYRELGLTSDVSSSTRVEVQSVRLGASSMSTGETLFVEAEVDVRAVLPDGYVLVSVMTGDLTALISLDWSSDLLTRTGASTLRCSIPNLPLLPGTYLVYVTVMPGGGVPVAESQERTELRVKGQVRSADHYGVIDIPADWSWSAS